MTGEQVLLFGRDILLPLVSLAYLVFLWYQRDRRKSRAESAVAERTVGATVNVKEAGGLGASVAFVEEAFRVERASKDRRIAEQDAEISELRNEIREVREENSELGNEIREVRKENGELSRRLSEALERIERLERRTP